MVKLLLGIDRSLYHLKFEKVCELADKLGSDGLEIQPEHPDIFKLYPDDAISNLNNILSRFNFKLSFHTPIKDLNISSYNPIIRRTSLNELKKSIKFAKKINAEHVVTHAGKNSFKTRSFFSKKYEKMALGLTINALKSINRLCKDLRINLSVENMTWSDWRLSSKIKYLEIVFEEIKELKLTIDIDHAIERSKRYVDKFIEVFEDRIISGHISNVKKNILHIKKLSNLPSLEYIVLEPHGLTYSIRSKILELIEDNFKGLRNLI